MDEYHYSRTTQKQLTIYTGDNSKYRYSHPDKYILVNNDQLKAKYNLITRYINEGND